MYLFNARSGQVKKESGFRDGESFSDRQGEHDGEAGAAAPAGVDADCAVVFLDGLADDGQTEAGAVGPGGEEGLENLVPVLLLDPGTVVADRDGDPVLTVGQADFLGLDLDNLPAGRAEGDGVLDQMAEDREHLPAISPDIEVVVEGELQVAGARPERIGPADLDHLGEAGPQRKPLPVDRFRLGELEEIGDRLQQAVRLANDDLGQLQVHRIGRGGGGKFPGQHLGRTGDGGQGVAEIVGDTGAHHADGGQFFGLAHLLFQALYLADIAQGDDLMAAAGVLRGVLWRIDRHRGVAEFDPGAILFDEVGRLSEIGRSEL